MRATVAWTGVVAALAACDSPTRPQPPAPPSVTVPPTVADPPSPPVDSPPDQTVGDYRGTYTLTVVATGTGAPCAFPDELKRRTYTATIDQNGDTLRVSLSDAAFEPGVDNFPAKATATGVTFSVRPSDPWDYGGPEVMERLSDGARLYVAGSFAAKGTPARLSWASNLYDGGSIIYHPPGLRSLLWGATAGCPVQSLEVVRR